jgi:hypothetical protein
MRVPRDRKPVRPNIPPQALWAAGAVAILGIGYFAFGLLVKPAAVVTSVSPPRAQEGQTVIVAGTGFEPDPARDVVRFGALEGKVTSAGETQLTVVVPAVPVPANAVQVAVAVQARGRRSNSVPFTVFTAPRIVSLEPDVAMPGDEVKAQGTHLDAKNLSINVAGMVAELRENQGSFARFRVPDVPVTQGKEIPVVARSGGEASPIISMTIGHLPLIKAIRPSQGPPGSRVTIVGRGFDPGLQGNAVSFEGSPSLVVTAKESEIVVIAPNLGLESQVLAAVSVRAKGGTTSGQDTFLVARPSAGTYVPHFFPAPVTEHSTPDHVFISMEIAPLMILTGKADAPSTVERAEKVAGALNTLVASIRGSLPPLEVREKPQVALAVVGNAEPLVVVTPDDAAAYDENWDAGPAAHHASPKALATYWMALLQDELGLFVLHQRPTVLAQMSPRGRVLLDLFSDAVRRGGPDAGVAMSSLNPLPPALAKSLRDLSLGLPVEGQGSAAAALEGTWVGTYDEPGVGTREFQVRFRLAGGKLAGDVTTRVGDIEMESPLTDPTFDKRLVRFTVKSGGVARRFSGTLEGAVISGTVEIPSKENGHFTLHFGR